jgi:uncharacterized protein YhbP (UPF0306 family)
MGDNSCDNAGETVEHAASHRRIQTLMTEQPYGVLCTQGEGKPYGSLIAFVANAQLDALVFTTPTDTHKFRLLKACDRVALVVDNRGIFRPDDPTRLDAVTATGRAVRLAESDGADVWRKRLIRKHPQMEGFITLPNSVMFRVDINRYTYVNGLQRVYHWMPSVCVHSAPMDKSASSQTVNDKGL